MLFSPALLVTSVLFTVMLALGLSLRPEAMQQWRTHPSLPLRVLLASCLLVPLLGLLLLGSPWSHALSPPARYAIALMAICPSAPLALRKAGSSGGDRQLAALLQVSAALAAIVSVPLLAWVFRQVFELEGWQIRPIDVALQVGRMQVLPLVLGLLLRQCRPRLAQRLEAPLETLANLMLVVLVVVVLIKVGPLLLVAVPADGGALLAMALLIAASLGIGRLFGGQAGRLGRTTALVTAMRNPGLALLFAATHGQHLPGLKLWILVYVLLTVLLSVPLVWWTRRYGTP
jgi:predicted Na+-dependent transporter